MPLVLLHGLTFDRRSWRPIVDRLGEDVCTIAVDLPAHGESAGSPCGLEELAARINRFLDGLGVEDPIVVGHSMSGSLAMIYAASHPVRGVVSVDAALNIGPFAEMIQRLEPALRGPGFAEAFAPFQASMGVDRVPEPVHQEIRQDVVLGYWEDLLRSDADRLEAWVQDVARRIDVPALTLFGQPLAPAERDHLRRLLPSAQIEEWTTGHCAHLVEADRFAARLREFAHFCEARRS